MANALHDEMRDIIEEARVILPGIQALFGFQTLVVFNERFMQLPEYARDPLLGIWFAFPLSARRRARRRPSR